MRGFWNILMGIFLFLACESNVENSGLQIENNSFEKVNVDQLFKSWELIELKSLINRVDDIIFHQNHILIVDRTLELLKVFDEEGNLQKTIDGDLLNNGNNIQPVCISVTNDGNVVFYDAGNEGFVFLNTSFDLLDFQKSDFYCYKLYPIQDGFLVFKNQSVQNNESSIYQFNILKTNQDFEMLEGYFPFTIEKNVTRNWQFFKDPLTVTEDFFEFYEPLSTNYYVSHLFSTPRKKPIYFSDRKLTESILASTNLNDPYVVMEEIFEKYALVNSRRILKESGWAIRYIDGGKSRYFYYSNTQNKGISMSHLLLTIQDKDLLIPFPIYESNNKWIAILDSDNYDQLNLSSYESLHPIVDDVIRKGKTYLVLLKD